MGRYTYYNDHKPPYTPEHMDSDLVPAGFACGDMCDFDQTIPLATAFVRPQCYQYTYTPESALANGTAFKELNTPHRDRNGR